MPNASFVAVVLDTQKTKPLDYKVPLSLQACVHVGGRVEVPFRNQIKKATIVFLKEKSDVENPKEILQVLHHQKVLQESLWKLSHWMAEYYCAPLQQVLRLFVPPNLRSDTTPKKEFQYILAISKQEAIDEITKMRSKSPKQAEMLENVLNSKDGHFKNCATLLTLLKKKLIQKIETMSFSSEEAEFFQTMPKELNFEQKECLASISTTLQAQKFGVHLIQGVTGSGKTEIYLQAIQETLKLGKTAIMLVPEVSLTSQTIERFRSRFPNKIAIWHHKRTLSQRAKAWEEMKEQKIDIVIGARSAIFCPLQNVGLIIVDEEHDPSYKSEDAPCYHGRDVAVMRGFLEKAAVILGSASPSLESRRNAEIGKYHLNKLNQRATNCSVANVTIIDMQQTMDRNGGFTHFSSELIDGIKKRIALGEQTLLFLNRRGFHRLQICAKCKTVVKCPNCDLGLTYHKADHLLRCHICDYHQNLSPKCVGCGSSESLQFKGFGTEHVERSLKAMFPTIRTLRMDRDTTKQKENHELIYQAFRAHKADVLIGTQMIAKGFHFPAVTLVGILNADPGLHIPDFRAAEQMFQLILQVSGRAGRSDLKGEVILQTFMPKHPVILLGAKQDYDLFYEKEIKERKQFGFPPFSHLVKITLFGKDAKEVESLANDIYTQFQKTAGPEISIFPPNASGRHKVKNLFRHNIVLRSSKISYISSFLKQQILPNKIKIDIDPISTFF